MGRHALAYTTEYALLVIAAGLAIVGVLFVRRGRWPVRVGDTPHCRRCDYILTGINAERCPECGSDLGGGRIVRGEGRRRPVLAAFGALLLIPLGLVTAVVTLTGQLHDVDWYHYRPTTWLIKDLNSPGVHVRAWDELVRRNTAGEISPANQGLWEDQMLKDLDQYTRPISDAPWNELQPRAAANKLSAARRDAWAAHQIKDIDDPSYSVSSRAWAEVQRLSSVGDLAGQQQSALIDRALKEQLKEIGGMHTEDLLDYAGRRCLEHAMTPEQEKQFFDNMMSLSLKTRPLLAPTDRVPYTINKRGRGPRKWYERVYFSTISVDGRKISDGGGGTSGSVGGGSIGSSINPQPVGHHQLQVSLKTGIDSQPHHDGSDTTPLLRSWTPTLTADFDVTEAGGPITFLTSPDSVTLANHFKAEQFEETTGYYNLQGQITTTDIPVNIAFDAFARIHGKEYPLGTITRSKANGISGVSVGLRRVPPEPFDTIDIILRSSESAARSTIDLAEIWKGEITILNVPVKHPPTF